MRRIGWFYLLLGLLVLVVYGQTLGHQLLALDDDIYVTNNPFVRDGFNWPGLWRALSGGYEWNWHPLTWLSHTLDGQLWGVRPTGHHLTNLLLHTANVWLLFALLDRTTGRRVAATAAAALFAVHPLHVEVVAWISARKDLLSTCAGLLTLHAYVRYATRPTAGRYASVAVLLAAGLLCKEMLVTLPAVMLLLDIWPLGRVPTGRWLRELPPRSGDRTAVPPAYPQVGWRRAVLEKLPLLGLSAASATVIFVVQRNIGAMDASLAISLPDRLANALVSYARYLENAVWPHDLGVLYAHPELAGGTPLTTAQIAAAGLMLTALVALVLHVRRRYAVVGMAWWFGTLVPVIGIVQIGGQARADRYAYLPHIGLYVAGAFALDELVRRRRDRRARRGEPAGPHRTGAIAPAFVVGALLIAALATRAAWQVRTWRTSETLFTQAIAVNPHNVPANFALAMQLDQRGESAAAESHLRAVLRAKPDHADARSRLAILLAERGQNTEAVRHFRLAAALAPDRAEIRFNLGLGLVRVGADGDAIAELGQALRLSPDYPGARRELLRALERESRRLGPTDPAAAAELGARAAQLRAASRSAGPQPTDRR